MNECSLSNTTAHICFLALVTSTNMYVYRAYFPELARLFPQFLARIVVARGVDKR